MKPSLLLGGLEALRRAEACDGGPCAGTLTFVLYSCCRGVIVVLSWCYSGVPVVFQWCCSGVAVVLQSCCSGVTVLLPWNVETGPGKALPVVKRWVLPHLAVGLTFSGKGCNERGDKRR
jgi:hypothetical protein